MPADKAGALAAGFRSAAGLIADADAEGWLLQVVQVGWVGLACSKRAQEWPVRGKGGSLTRE